jgi:hypothetical protein
VPERNTGVSQTVIPNPDPSAITAEAIDRRVNNAERVISARIDGMEKAVGVFQGDLTRVPTQLDRAIESLRSLLEARQEGASAVIKQRLDGMDKAIELFQKFTDRTPEYVRDQVTHLRELHEAGFESIRTQFILLKQATEQLDLANKTAIAAALQAQKESAGETQKSSQAAIAKSENSTSEAIKALTTTFNAAITGATDRINDLKSRLDRGEGKTNVTDPMMESRFAAIMSRLDSVTTSRDTHAGSDATAAVNSAKMLGIIAIAVALAVGIGDIVVRLAH